ncbi:MULTISPECIES: CopG family antitoxin [unclassified Bartonella]
MKTSKLKQIPVFKTDEEAENFVDTADLTDYDLTDFKSVHFEFLPKEVS